MFSLTLCHPRKHCTCKVTSGRDPVKQAKDAYPDDGGRGIACIVVLFVLPFALWWPVVGVWCLLNHSILLFEIEPLPKPETHQFK